MSILFLLIESASENIVFSFHVGNNFSILEKIDFTVGNKRLVYRALRLFKINKF